MSTTASSSTQNPPPSPSLSTSTSPSMISPTLPHSPETARQIAEARTFLEASISNIGSTLDASLQTRAQNLHSNSKQLEKQQKEVEKATEGLRKENEKLGAVARDGLKKVKELGNVQNWAEMLERDFLVLQETVRLANGGREEGDSASESGSGSWTGSEMSEGEDGEEGRFKDMGVWPLELDDGVLGGPVNGVAGSGTSGGGSLDVGESSKLVVDPTVHMDDQEDLTFAKTSVVDDRYLAFAEPNNRDEGASNVGKDLVMKHSTRSLVEATNHLADTRSLELPVGAESLEPGAEYAKHSDVDAEMAEHSILKNGDDAVVESSGHADVGKPAKVIEQPKQPQVSESSTLVDSEGDIQMVDSVSEDKGKGKEREVLSDPTAVIIAQQTEVLGNPSPGTARPGTDPSSASVHTSSSVIS